MSLTYREVAEILKIIDASGCDEVVLELDGTRIAVRRSASGATARSALPSPLGSSAMSASLPVSAASAAPVRPATKSGAAEDKPAAGTIETRAPMVGTFYRRPSPDQPAFVEIGQAVAKGQPLCLIEVMKLFTTVEAPASGVVDAILPEDGALVEFDQLLFRIRPS